MTAQTDRPVSSKTMTLAREYMVERPSFVADSAESAIRNFARWVDEGLSHETTGCPECTDNEADARRANVLTDRIAAAFTAQRLALLALVDAAEDTLRAHPETECCAVTRLRCKEARAVLASHEKGAQETEPPRRHYTVTKEEQDDLDRIAAAENGKG